jgi:hypothetical protein
MKTPTITLNGNTFKAKKPKVKMWRRLIKIQNSQNELESDEGLDELLDFFCVVFNDEKVTPDSIEENLDLDDFFTLFQDIGTWIGELVGAKTGEIPNGQEEIVKN